MVTFLQVNARDINNAIEVIANNAGNAIGFEITQQSVIDVLNVNIDPQHTGIKYGSGKTTEPFNKSAAKWVLENIYGGFPCEDDVLVFPPNLDLDAVVAGVLYLHKEDIIELENASSFKDGYRMELITGIVNQINTVDCGLGNITEYDQTYHEKQLLIKKDVSWYQILSAFVKDYKVSIEDKVEKVWAFLIDGSPTLFETWERQIRREKLHQEQAKILFPNGVTYVHSEAYGATGLVYSIAPYGVAFNPVFPTKDGTIPKYTICQFTADKYIDLPAIVSELNELETGWGGNMKAGIAGSPFCGTKLDYETVCAIVAKHVK